MKKIGRFLIEEELGRGGMGMVYRANDPILERTVAIKFLLPKMLANKDALLRFLREARVSAKLDHPNIVKIYDIGSMEAEKPGKGIEESYYIVMEYIEGKTLQEIIDTKAQIDIESQISIFLQICEGIEYAHEQKVIHRDLKPENIMITDDQRVKIMDYGLACLEGRHSLTQVGAVMGTIAYFSPEQADGKDVDLRTDIYSLGVMLYEMLTSQLPFIAQNPSEMIKKHLSTPPPLPTKINPRIPVSIERVILKMLQKLPAARYQNMTELINDLRSSSSSIKDIKEAIKDVSPQEETKKTEISEKFPDVQVEQKDPEKTLIDEVSKENTTIGEDNAALTDGRYDKILEKLKKDQGIRDKLVSPNYPNLKLTEAICFNCEVVNNVNNEFCSQCGAPLSPGYLPEHQEAKALNKLGADLLNKGRIDEALYQFSEAIDKDPALIEAQINLGRAYLENKEIEKAQEKFSSCMFQSPDNPSPHIMMAQLYKQLGKPEEALIEYKEALRLNPKDIQTAMELALLFTQLQNWDHAIYYYRQIIKLDNQYPESRKQLGGIFVSLKRYGEAIEQFEAVLRLCPNDLEISETLGDLYIKSNKLQKAEKTFQSVITSNPKSANSFAQLGRLYELQKRENQAIMNYRYAIDLDPSNKDARIGLAQYHLKGNQKNLAVKELEEAAKYYPQDPTIQRQLGYLALNSNQLEKAIEHFERSVELEPMCADLHNKLGQIYLKRDQSDKSIFELKKAVDLKPYEPEFHEDLAMAFYGNSKVSDAIDELKKASTLDSKNKDYLKALGIMLVDEGSLDEAIKILKEIEPDTQTHALLGKAYSDKKLFNMALFHYQKALELEPKSILVHYYTAQTLKKQGKPEESMEYLRKIIEIITGSENEHIQRDLLTKAYIELGKSHIQSGEYLKAREYLEETIKLDPFNAKPMFYLAQAYFYSEDYKSSYEISVRALEIEPQNTEIMDLLGQIYIKQRDFELANKVYQKLAVYDPKNTEFQKNLAEVLFLQGNYEMSLNIINNAIGLKPRDIDYYYWKLGLICMKMKKYLNAVSEIKKAIQFNNKSWKYYESLAEALLLSGNRAEGKSAIEKALNLSPPHNDAKKLEIRLRHI